MTDKPPLKLADLVRRCDSRNGENKLVVRRHQLSASVGGSPTFKVVGMYDGSDWNKGNTFLELDHPVQAAGDEFDRERRMQHEMSETIGFLYLALTHKGASAADKLAEVVRILRARTGIKLKDCTPGEVPDVMTSVRALVETEMAKRAKKP